MANFCFKRLMGRLETFKFMKTTTLSATSFQKRFMETKVAHPNVSALESLSSSSLSFQYLMDSFGLPFETAISTSQKLQLEEKNSDKHESVITFLKSLQFSDEHIKKLIARRPAAIHCKIENNLKPKFRYLTDIGFVGSLLPELIVANPVILCRSLSCHIKPSIDFLKTYLVTDENVVAAVKRLSKLLTVDLKKTLQPNIDFLRNQGVPLSTISKFIMTQPRSMLLKADRMVYAVETIKKLGLKPSAPMFVHSVRVLLSMSDMTWKKKVDLLKSLGWSDEDIISALKHNPLSLACSEEKIKSVMDFYMNTMKLDPAFIAGYPKFIMYAIDRRIRPRYNVLKMLESKKLFKESKNSAWILTRTEKDFLNTYVIKHLAKVPNLMELYHGKIVADKIEV